MRCYKCGAKYIEHKGKLNLQNKTIGDYEVSLDKYYKCEDCGALLFPKEAAKKIESIEAEKRDNLIRKLPIGDFIMAKEAAEILGISKQAFSKNRRIKNNFIYSTIVGGKKIYSKKSVQLFKEKEDGRFNLSNQVAEKHSKYVMIQTVTGGPQIPNSYINNLGEFPGHFWKQEVKTPFSKLYH